MKASTIRVGLRRRLDTLPVRDNIHDVIAYITALAHLYVNEIDAENYVTLDFAIDAKDGDGPIAIVMSRKAKTVSIPTTLTRQTFTFCRSEVTPEPVVILYRRTVGQEGEFKSVLSFEGIEDVIIDVAAEFFGGGADKMKAEFTSMREAGQ